MVRFNVHEERRQHGDLFLSGNRPEIVLLDDKGTEFLNTRRLLHVPLGKGKLPSSLPTRGVTKPIPGDRGWWGDHLRLPILSSKGET